jgi:ATP-dependent DNA helicase RecQ
MTATNMTTTPLSTLKKYFGYDSFLPLQESIIKNVLSGNDCLVLMPTGGGKSLCYQLPALMLEGIAIVVSPLIALMKDQVDALVSSGAAAAYINSSLDYDEIDNIKARLKNGEIKILYIAPERLMMPEFLSFIKSDKIDIKLIAVDEAHCISEWGHDFRPEYRQLAVLKNSFPSASVIALTATATAKVQDDIVHQLKIADAKTYRSSFRRPNLNIKIEAKIDPYQQLLKLLDKHKKDTGIVYCQSRKQVDTLASALQRSGHKALPYHAGMSAVERSVNQDRFVKDEVEIIVATIAFGMGIDKSNVRFVVHYDLPKNLEGYYQEIGRAGRDGLESDCILFFNYGDKVKQEHFIRQKESATEREIAYRKLQEMVDFCMSSTCRHEALLKYFGENTGDSKDMDSLNCRACDICLEPREVFDATIEAQKVLSTVFRVNERFGTSHVIDILLGSKNKKLAAQGHDTLSTHGIGKDRSRLEWRLIIQEMIGLEYLVLDEDGYSVLKIGSRGKLALTGKEKVFLTKPKIEIGLASSKDGKQTNAGSKKSKIDEKDVDSELFEILRDLRKNLADDANLPPYIIFPDTTLKEMAAYYPGNLAALSGISGVGEVKLKKYGEAFLSSIIDYCAGKGIETQKESLSAKALSVKTASQTKTMAEAPATSASSTINETLKLHNEGFSITEIASKRSLKVTTIAAHLEWLILNGEEIDIDRYVSIDNQKEIERALDEIGADGIEMLRPIKDLLGDNISYDQIKLVRAKTLKKLQDAGLNRDDLNVHI